MKITLATLEQATAQEVFDQVATHLLTQMKVCRRQGSSRCMYRSVDEISGQALMCAAGCLISDEEYHEKDNERMSYGNEFEKIGAWSYLLADGIVPLAHDFLISKLQQLHDGVEPYNWEINLRLIAYAFNLNEKAINALRCGTIQLPGNAFTLWTRNVLVFNGS